MPKRVSVARYMAVLDIDMYEANSEREVVCEFKYRKFAVRYTDRSPDKRLRLTSCVKRDLLCVKRDLLCVKET